MEKLDFLIEYLLTENKEMKIEKMPTNMEDKKNLWRSLCNIRDVKPISNEYLKIEKEYLQEELKNKSIVKVETINSISNTINEINLKNKDKICLWKGDITVLEIEAIVNAANSGGLRLFCSLP
ncbi:MAG: hypothetical protein OSJ66_04380 [Clostridia bacterium]|nr:hypothetical protein [Clostridia bacterium]